LILVAVSFVIIALSKQQNLANSKDQKTADQTNRPPKDPPRRAPSHKYKNYDHPSENEHRTAEQFNWKITNRLNVFIIFFTFGTAVFAGLAYFQAKRQADAEWQQTIITKAQIAAYINFVTIDIEPISGGLSITPNWKNSGETEARNLQEAWTVDVIPDTINAHSFCSVPDKAIIDAPVSEWEPGVIHELITQNISSQAVQAAQAGVAQIVLVGSFRFFDVFAGDPQKIVNWCYLAEPQSSTSFSYLTLKYQD